MKIAIDITYKPYGGTKTQIVNMLSHFSKMSNIKIFIYLTKRNLDIIENINKKNVVIKMSYFSNLSLATRLLWQQLFLPLHLLFNRTDVLFCPGNISPIISPVKRVQWIGTIGPFFNQFYTHFNYFNRII